MQTFGPSPQRTLKLEPSGFLNNYNQQTACISRRSQVHSNYMEQDNFNTISEQLAPVRSCELAVPLDPNRQQCVLVFHLLFT